MESAKEKKQIDMLHGSIWNRIPLFALLLIFGHSLLAIFNNDPTVIATGYIRLMTITLSHTFCLVYEVVSGYLRGFGISLIPAVLTTIGICGIRIAWIQMVFPQSQTFRTIMNVYPVSLSVTGVLLVFASWFVRIGGLL